MTGTQPDTRSRLKVWRPAGFDGVELEIFRNVEELFYAPLVLETYDLTVATGGGTLIRYAGGTYKFDDMGTTFFTENPGEVFANEPHNGFYGCRDMWNLRLTEAKMQNLLGALEVEREVVRFPSMLTSDALNGPLAKLLVETVDTFDRPASLLERESRLLDLVHTVLKHCSETPPPEQKLDKEHKAVSLVKEVLDAHPEIDVTLSDLATLTALNKHYLYRVFRRDVGVSPHVYQSVRQVCKAKDLLAEGVAPAQVALETGFNDQSHLTHVFKKHTQVTPSRFQRDSLGDGLMTELGT